MRTFIYITILLILAALPAMAQEPGKQSQGVVSVKQNRAERVRGKLELDMDINLRGLTVGRYQTLSLMPMLRLGKDSLVMAPVVLNGSNKQKMYNRTLALRGKEAADDGAYQVIKNTSSPIEVSYKHSIPYHPWMANAQLVLVGELCDYEGSPIQIFINVLTDKLSLK